MLSVSRLLFTLLAIALLAGCGSRDFSDLDAFMNEKRARPGGIIDPIPTFKAYEAFSYGATRLRSPFEGRRKFKGTLKGIEGDEVVVQVDDHEYLLPHNAIEKARIQPRT